MDFISFNMLTWILVKNFSGSLNISLRRFKSLGISNDQLVYFISCFILLRNFKKQKFICSMEGHYCFNFMMEQNILVSKITGTIFNSTQLAITLGHYYFNSNSEF